MAEEEANKPFKLMDRDILILEHVARYSITTPEVIHHLFFGDRDETAVSKVTRRLREAGFLSRYQLFDKNRYFVLGPKTAPDSPHAGKPWGVIRLVEAYATLMTCCMGEKELTYPTLAEWPRWRNILGLTQDCPHATYYLEEQDNGVRLNWIRVDHGIETRRLPPLVYKKISPWLKIPSFRKLADAGGFGVTVVTGKERKQLTLEASFQRRPIEGVKVTVALQPDLDHLIAWRKLTGGQRDAS
jgi:hypothetical protein